ncbi:MAG: helix-turn-helix domain-containing protein [Bacteroidia bacterium]
MKSRKENLLPKINSHLALLGEQIKLARLRRQISVMQVAERAHVSRSSVWLVEKGAPSVAMGTYCQILFVLGLEKDILLVAKDDELGRKLQDAEILPKKRAPRQKKKT